VNPKANERSRPFFRTRFWMLAATLWTVAVLLLALTPTHKNSWLLRTFGDKALHAAAFTVGCLLWAKSLEALRPLHRIWAALAGACVALSIGVIIELLQKYIPGRASDLSDFWADVIGVLPSLAYLTLTSRRRKPAEQP
jgi:VanZ family protein